MLDHLDDEVELARAAGVEMAGAQADRHIGAVGGDCGDAGGRDLVIAMRRAAAAARPLLVRVRIARGAILRALLRKA